jgi:radical SAM superfamily enzyme with C-terminal helix-hairpin-helix motif
MRKYSMMFLITALSVAALIQAPSRLFAGQAVAPPAGGHSMPMHGQHVGTLDLNSASLEELQMVPGVNEATAKKIVENRPYARTDELITKKVLSKTAYDSIKEHIAVTKPAGK